MAEIQVLACLPLSHPEASLPWKSPDTRYHVFEAQVLPMLNSTFRMESHLRVFGLTNQSNIVFKRPRGWRERPPGNSSSCSPIRGRRWELSLQSESCDAWSAAFAPKAEGRSEAGSILPRGSAEMQRALLRAVPEADGREVVQETSMPRVPNRAGGGLTRPPHRIPESVPRSRSSSLHGGWFDIKSNRHRRGRLIIPWQ